MTAHSFFGSKSCAWMALVVCTLCGCNLILDNEKRSLVAGSIAGTGSTRSGFDSGYDAGNEAGQALGYDAGVCDSPVQECVPGSIEMVQESCGTCGGGLRNRERACTGECHWGPYGDWGQCEMPTEGCTPGKLEEKFAPCGPCEMGMRKSTRSCSNACAWSAWKDDACVADELLCEPGSHKELPAVTCDAMCGTSKQVLTCNATCGWGPVESGECEGQGPCKPGETRMAASAGCNPDFCMKGVQPQIETCTKACTWGMPTNSGNCTIPSGVCRPKDLGGTGFRCRADDPGFRELCTASTASAADRCTFAGREAFSGC